MPSPISSPTSERLPSHSWSLTNQSYKNEQITNDNMSDDNCLSKIDEINIQSDINQRLDFDPYEGCSDEKIRKKQMSHQPESSNCSRPSRLGLTLDLSCNSIDNSNKTQNRKYQPFGINFKRIIPEPIDITIQLEKQSWFHGHITRIEAENVLKPTRPASYLVRNCENSSKDYSLSIKSTFGFIHIKIVSHNDGRYILGNFSKSFNNVPEMINHYSFNNLPLRGAEHMSLLYPINDQLL